MRRGACLLALLGLTVQNAMGDDFFSAGTARPTAAPAGTAAVGAPQKFSRSGESAATNDELKSYYKELFGDSTPATSLPVTDLNSAARTAMPGSSARTPLPGAPASPVAVKPTSAGTSAANPGRSSVAPVTPAAAVANPMEDDIVHAEYRTNSGATSPIQQVHGERFSARPFPGAGGQDSTFGQTAEIRTPAEAATPSVQTALSPAATVPSSGKGSLSFSRSGSAVPGKSSISTPVATIAPQRSASPSLEMKSATSMSTAAPAVTVEWQKQSEINVGQECKCFLLVKNSGPTAAQDVEVRATFPSNVRLISAQPTPDNSEKFLAWNMSELKAGEQRSIEITMIPMERGDINTRADVRFSGVANGLFAVAEPMLDIQLEGPAKVLIGEPASQLVTVSNPGTGILTHVQIEALIPEGLEHTRGQRLLMELGNLNPGENRSVRLALAAAKGGHHHIAVQAKSESGLSRTAECDVDVIAPMLAATIQGPGMRYVGRQGSYTLSVSNDGVAATDNVQLRYKVPEGFDFVSADRGAQYDPATRLVTWFVGRLDKGEKTEIHANLLARQLGDFKHLIRATSEHGAIADAECLTAVEGTSSLSMSIKDTEDPVEVGSKTCYDIKVRNEGSAGARAVALTCELPNGMTFISAEGPAEFVCEGNTVVFRPLAEVTAGQVVSFKVFVAAKNPGSLRFRTNLLSQSVTEPLSAEEMTKFYGE